MNRSGFGGAVVAVMACALLFSFDAAAQVYGPIQSLYAPGKCMDIPLGNRDNKVQAQIYDCNGGDNQQWAFIDMGFADGWGQLRNLYSGKCLDVRGGFKGIGIAVQQYTCGQGDHQLFRRHSLSGLLQVKHSELCIGPYAGNTSNKAPLAQIGCIVNDPYPSPSPLARWNSYFWYSSSWP
jgi:hypothetical protein